MWKDIGGEIFFHCVVVQLILLRPCFWVCWQTAAPPVGACMVDIGARQFTSVY